MDSSRQDLTSLIARSVKVNAGVWANDLTVTIGRNTVTKDKVITQVNTGSLKRGAVKPKLAIDISQLGGMYAGKIHMIGTESGVGVRNAGIIGISAGDVMVTVNGNIENTDTGILRSGQNLTVKADGELHNQGTLSASGNMIVDVKDNIKNIGTLYSGQNLEVIADGGMQNRGTLYALMNTRVEVDNLTNNGIIAAGQDTTILAETLDSTRKSLLAAGLGNDGDLANNGTLKLGIKKLLNANGKNVAAGRLVAGGEVINLSHSQTRGKNIDIMAEGNIDIGNAQIVAQETVDVYTDEKLSNKNGKIYGKNIALKASLLHNPGGTIAARNGLNIGVHTLNNRKNALLHSGQMMVIGGMLDDNGKAIDSADTLNNHSATIQSLGGMAVSIENINNINEHLVMKFVEVEDYFSGEVTKPIVLETAFWPGHTLMDSLVGQDIRAQQPTAVIGVKIDNLAPLDSLIPDFPANDLLARFLNQQPQLPVVAQVQLPVDDEQPQSRIVPAAPLPASSLNAIKADVTSQYLLKTNAGLTNQKERFDSNYMQKSHSKNADMVQKRLGNDYGQQLIQEQAIRPIGQTCLAGRANDADKFKAWMNSGISVRQKHQLTSGIALTAAQMAILTSDIVQDVTLFNGSSRHVTKLHAQVKPGDLDDNGILLKGNNVALEEMK